MTPSRPYLIRAIYEWIADNGYTPYISVDTTTPRTNVPKEYIKNNCIVLDISTISTQQLLIDNEAITFKARFGSITYNLYMPIQAVTTIYAQENNNGMAFSKEEYQSDERATNQSTPDVTPLTANRFQPNVISGGKNKDLSKK